MSWVDHHLAELKRRSLSDQAEVVLERAKILERAWFLLCELTMLHRFDPSGYAQSPRVLSPNWLLVEELLRRSLVGGEATCDPFSLPVGPRRHQIHQHVRALVLRVCHLSLHWSPITDVMFKLWDFLRKGNLQDLDGERREFPAFLQTYAGLSDLSPAPGDSTFHLFLKLLCQTLHAMSPQPGDLDPTVARNKEKKLIQTLSRFTITIPTSLRYVHEGRSLSGVAISSLRNYASLDLCLNCAAPRKSQLVSAVRRLVGMVDFESSDDAVSRGVVFEALTILCKVCQFNKIPMDEVATEFILLLGPLCERFAEEEKRRPAMSSPLLSRDSAPHLSADDRAKWAARQERLQRLIVTGIKSIQHVVSADAASRGFLCGEHLLFSRRWTLLLVPSNGCPEPLRKHVIDVIRAFLVARASYRRQTQKKPIAVLMTIPSTTKGTDSARPPTLVEVLGPRPGLALPQPAAAVAATMTDSQESDYGDMLTDLPDFDFDALEKLSEVATAEARREQQTKEANDATLVTLLSGVILQDVTGLINSKFRKQEEIKPGPELFFAAIDCVAEVAEACVQYKIKSWDYFFGSFGPNSHFTKFGEGPELRQIPFRFVSSLVAQTGGEVLEKFEAECVNCWFLSNVDYSASVQHVLSNSFHAAVRRPVIFDGLPETITQHFPFTQATYKQHRVALLGAVLNNVGRLFHESSQRFAHDPTRLSTIRRQMLQYLTGISLTMKKCIKELQAKSNDEMLGRYHELCYAIIGQLMASCARIIYERNAANALLPSLITDFFSSLQTDLASAYLVPQLSSLLQTLGQLDFRSDAYLKRTLVTIFQHHFEPICGHPGRVQSEDARLRAFVKAMHDWSNVSFLPEPARVHEFRVFVLGTHLRRYLTAHLTRRDYAHTSVSAFKVLTLLCRRLYLAPSRADDRRAPAAATAWALERLPLFQADLRVVFLPIVEALGVCEFSSSHTAVRSAGLAYFSHFLEALRRFQGLTRGRVPADDEWERLVGTLLQRIVAETIMAVSQVWGSASTSKDCHALRARAASLPSVATVRNTFPYDSPDFVSFNLQFPFQGKNSRITVMPEPIGQQVEDIKKAMLGSVCEVWLGLLANPGLAAPLVNLLHRVLGEVVSIASRFYAQHPLVLILKQKLLLPLRKKGQTYLALLERPNQDLSLSGLLL